MKLRTLTIWSLLLISFMQAKSVATGGGGLNKLDIESGEFVHYTTREGLLSNTITNVWLDGQW